MNILGIDYGQRKIGIAFTEGFLPSPHSVVRFTKKEVAAETIRRICNQLEIQKIVIGKSNGINDKEAEEFAGMLEELTQLPIEFVDETLTSRESIRLMVEAQTSQKKRRELEDAVAATLILQTYLENHKETSHTQ